MSISVSIPTVYIYIYQCYYHYYYNYSYYCYYYRYYWYYCFSGYCCCHCCCGCYCNGIIDIHIIIVMNNISICGIPSKCVLIVKNDQHCTTLIGFSDPRFRPEWIRHVWKCLLKATMDPWNGYLHWEKHSQTIFLGSVLVSGECIHKFVCKGEWLVGKGLLCNMKHIWFNWAILLPILAQDWSS